MSQPDSATSCWQDELIRNTPWVPRRWQRAPHQPASQTPQQQPPPGGPSDGRGPSAAGPLRTTRTAAAAGSEALQVPAPGLGSLMGPASSCIEW